MISFRRKQRKILSSSLTDCRWNSISCRILTTVLMNFPPIVQTDTGTPTGETWYKTYMEYAWAKRTPDNPLSPSNTSQYDYPVSLFLRMQRDADGAQQPSETANIEYEFYEMSHDPNLNQFDTSICYRSKRYEYFHLVFVLEVTRDELADSPALDRFQLDQAVQYNLINRMQIRYSRVTDLEIDHEQIGNELTVFFTLLGQTPDPNSPSGFVEDEITAQRAHDIIKEIIDDGQFEFEMHLGDNSTALFRGKPDSLIASEQYISTHSRGRQMTNDTYTIGSQVTAAVVGAVIGLFAGVALAALLRIIRKKRTTSPPSSIANPAQVDLQTRTTTDTSDA